MTHLLLLALGFIAMPEPSLPTTSFPGGTITIPQECTAPAELEWVVDVFAGSVECGKAGLRVGIWGDPMYSDPCKTRLDPLGLPARSDVTRIPLASGDSLIVCTDHSPNGKAKTPNNRLIIDLGGGTHLWADIRTAKQAYLMLKIAMSFKPTGNSNGR